MHVYVPLQSPMCSPAVAREERSLSPPLLFCPSSFELESLIPELAIFRKPRWFSGFCFLLWDWSYRYTWSCPAVLHGFWRLELRWFKAPSGPHACLSGSTLNHWALSPALIFKNFVCGGGYGHTCLVLVWRWQDNSKVSVCYTFFETRSPAFANELLDYKWMSN